MKKIGSSIKLLIPILEGSIFRNPDLEKNVKKRVIDLERYSMNAADDSNNQFTWNTLNLK